MKNLTEEIVNTRMAEPLETELKKREIFQKQRVKMRHAMQKWSDPSNMTQEQVEAFSLVEETLSEYTYIYGETAYRLGYSDGMLVGMEQGTDRRKSILSLKDMTSLISVYDAIKKLNITMLGRLEVHKKDDGILGALDGVLDVIENGICAKIKLLEDDTSIEKITYILDQDMLPPEKRAKLLLGME